MILHTVARSAIADARRNESAVIQYGSVLPAAMLIVM